MLVVKDHWSCCPPCQITIIADEKSTRLNTPLSSTKFGFLYFCIFYYGMEFIWRLRNSPIHVSHQTVALFTSCTKKLSSSWNKTTREDVWCERKMWKKKRQTCERERQRERDRARALTVIETALASPLVSWVAGSVPACQPVCHHHCLVFSLRPSACSLYTGSCSGLTCFLYIDTFIAAPASPFSPRRTGGQCACPWGIFWDGIIFHKKLSLSCVMSWYDVDKEKQMTTMCFITVTGGKKRLIQ